MALPKLFQRIFFHNNTTPSINEDNFNAVSKGLSDVDDRVISLAGTIMEDVPQIQEDMEELEADMALIDTKIASATAEANRATTAANNAAASVISAGNKALVSEGWAKGTQNGTAVGSSSPYYHNNAEYFKNQARSFTPQGYQDLVDDVDSLKETLTKNGAHNLMPMTLAGIKAANTRGTWSGNAYTYRGITYTLDTDDNGNITQVRVNGTAAQNSLLYIVRDYKIAAFNDCIINGVSGGNSTSYGLFVMDTDYTIYAFDYDGDCNIETIGNNKLGSIYMQVVEGYTANNLVFKPMIRLASDPDSTFEPYAMTNRELTNVVNNELSPKSELLCGIDSTGLTTDSYTNVTLNKSIKEFRLIRIFCSYYASGLPDWGGVTISTEYLREFKGYDIIIPNVVSDVFHFEIRYVNDTTIKVKLVGSSGVNNCFCVRAIM